MQEKQLDKINELISQQEFESAKEELNKFLEEDENNVEALKSLGLCNINLGFFDEARKSFETVVKYKADDASSWFYLAKCYDNLDDFLHAKSAYLEVIALREDYVEAYKNLCVVCLKTKDEEKGIEFAKKALEKVQDDYSIYYLLGTAYLSIKKFSESIPYLEKALELNPEHSQLYNNLGTVYLSQNQYDKAYNCYLKASELDPRNSITFYNIGSILQIQGKHKEACEFFQKAYDVEGLEHYIVALALSEYKSAQYESAIKHYKFLVAQHPEKQNFQYNLVCCYEHIGENTFAISILEQLVYLNPKNLTMAQKLANLYMKVDQPQKAKELYNLLISKNLVSAEVYYDYAMICAKTNDIATAETILKKVVELNPDFAHAHKDLGVIYLSKRLFDYAQDEFEKAMSIAPGDFLILYEYANFLHATSKFEQAQQYYDSASELCPNNPNIMAFSALNLISLNKLEEALGRVKRALDFAKQDDFLLFLVGKINFLLKNYEDAKFFLISSLELNQTLDVKNLLALTYFELGEYEQANNIFLSLLKDLPTNTMVLINSAKCYEKLGDVKSAKKQLKKALKIFPELEEAKEMLKGLK